MCVQEPAAPTRRGRRKPGKLGAGLRDHWGGPGVKPYTVGGGAKEGEGADVGNFPKPASTVPQFGGWGGTTQRAPFLGVTPPPRQAGFKRTRDGFFFLPSKRLTLPMKERNVFPVTLHPATTSSTLKFELQKKKKSPSKTPLARVWD